MIKTELKLLADIRLVLAAESLFQHFNESGQFLSFAVLIRAQNITEGMTLLAFAHVASFLVYRKVMSEAACADRFGVFDFPKLEDLNLPLPSDLKARRVVREVYKLLHGFFESRTRAMALVSHRLTADRIARLKSFPHVEADDFDEINTSWKDVNLVALTDLPAYQNLFIKLSERHEREENTQRSKK